MLLRVRSVLRAKKVLSLATVAADSSKNGAIDDVTHKAASPRVSLDDIAIRFNLEISEGGPQC